ncbi:MAG: polyphosphate kinase, partial [Gammaproteobacteria bacterium]
NNISNDEASTTVQADKMPDIDTQQELKTTTVLDVMDMSLSLPKKEYRQQLQSYQARLNQLHRNALKKGMSTILVFEGPDAAGKGGAIRRVTAALDARHYQVFPIAAPTDEERAHHYLWRFWRHLSRAGKITIFDRSWYGRVLVERIEGFAQEDEWRRAYSEINSFEEMLTDSGILLMKYWIHVTKDEQLNRFKERETTPHKQWKLTEEDWRNREKWDEYEHAVNDIVERTSTTAAPWTLIEGNDKRYARVKVIKTLCEQMELALKGNIKSWGSQ